MKHNENLPQRAAPRSAQDNVLSNYDSDIASVTGTVAPDLDINRAAKSSYGTNQLNDTNQRSFQSENNETLNRRGIESS